MNLDPPEQRDVADDDGYVQWQPPRGPMTRVVAWAILLFIALSVAAMIAVIVYQNVAG